MKIAKKCNHEFEVAVWEYKRLEGLAPTHSMAKILYCKRCLILKEISPLENLYYAHSQNKRYSQNHTIS